MKIGNFEIGNSLSPYIIAEIGVNHEADMALAKLLIEQAAKGGAHAVKFQTYKAGLIASKDSPAYWDQKKEPTNSQYELFKKYDSFGPEQYLELAEHCKKFDVAFMSTPFDLDAVDFLNPLMPAFKMASADITNLPLIRKCASLGKPMIISTGASTLAEIEFALKTAKDAGAKEIALLHCVLNYPTPEKDAQLGMISTLKRVFPEYVIGYSDHVAPDESMSSLEAAMLLGACVIEKHFTHDKTLPGNDHYHSMNQQDLERFMAKAKKYELMVSGTSKDLKKESAARQHARRSIVAEHKIKQGTVITEDMLIAKRPAHGISPIHWDEIIGSVAIVDIEEDTVLQWPMIKVR